MTPSDFTDDPEVIDALEQMEDMSDDELVQYIERITDSMIDAMEAHDLSPGTLIQMAVGGPKENGIQSQCVSNINGEIAGMMMANQMATHLNEAGGVPDFIMAFVADLATKVDGKLLGLLGAAMLDHAPDPDDVLEEVMGNGTDDDGPQSLYEDF